MEPSGAKPSEKRRVRGEEERRGQEERGVTELKASVFWFGFAMGNMPVVEVGVRKVRVKRLLSEGGFAHVYKVSCTYEYCCIRLFLMFYSIVCIVFWDPRK